MAVDWLFVQSRVGQKIVEVVVLTMIYLIQGNFVGVAALFLIMCAMIGAEIGNLTAKMWEHLRVHGIMCEDVVRQFQIRYQQVSEVASDIDRMFNKYLAINMALSFGVICFAVYHVSRDKGELVDTGFIVILVFLAVMLAVTSSPAYLHAHAGTVVHTIAPS